VTDEEMNAMLDETSATRKAFARTVKPETFTKVSDADRLASMTLGLANRVAAFFHETPFGVEILEGAVHLTPPPFEVALAVSPAMLASKDDPWPAVDDWLADLAYSLAQSLGTQAAEVYQACLAHDPDPDA
jgi:hypothetical protein